MELISSKISTKDVLRKMMYADNLAIIAESKQELQEVLEEWKGVFMNHGRRMSLEKTEVMWVGHQRKELNIRLDSKEIKQVDGFVYLGGMVMEDGHSEAKLERMLRELQINIVLWPCGILSNFHIVSDFVLWDFLDVNKTLFFKSL